MYITGLLELMNMLFSNELNKDLYQKGFFAI